MEADEMLLQIRRQVEQRIRTQIARHQRVDPTADPRQIVSLALEQETERLHLLADRFEDEGNENAAEFVRAVADDWLPAQQFTRI